MPGKKISYLNGFGNHFCSEAEKGALPQGQNSPQRPPKGLYAEQLTGSAFSAPRATNKRSWLYRIRPSVVHAPYTPYQKTLWLTAPDSETMPSPNQMRWDRHPMPKERTDFIDGIITFATCGTAAGHSGMGIHIYSTNQNMLGRFFYNADGELLIVPQYGRLHLRTEMGLLELQPREIAVIPRGIKFAVDLPDGQARGYICENYGTPFTLPDLGPIGANGLANPRDFLTPTAAYENNEGPYTVIAKLGGNLWQGAYEHSPLDVVAWHGNYAPYKYDLNLFNTINTVSYDHADPSIFTVLTAPSGLDGVANIDFAIFPPRWMVAENTFRPPYFHRNLMSEFMGLIDGVYDGKEGGGFEPGGCSLHNCMSGHGPDAGTFEKASKAKLQPHYIDGSMAFMFESRLLLNASKYAVESPFLQSRYHSCWQDLPKLFKA